MDNNISRLLKEMEDSGQSETAGVADILRMIAENGGDMETAEHLFACAKEIAAAAGYFIQQLASGAERSAGKMIALAAEETPPAFLVIGDEPSVPCLRCLVEKLSERFANGKAVMLVQNIEDATSLLSVADTPQQLSDDIADARIRHFLDTLPGSLVWFNPQENEIKQVFDTTADALAWLKNPPASPDQVCDMCDEKIKPGDEVLTPCGKTVHNVPQDNSGESCLEAHLRDCLQFECNHRHA